MPNYSTLHNFLVKLLQLTRPKHPERVYSGRKEKTSNWEPDMRGEKPPKLPRHSKDSAPVVKNLRLSVPGQTASKTKPLGDFRVSYRLAKNKQNGRIIGFWSQIQFRVLLQNSCLVYWVATNLSIPKRDISVKFKFCKSNPSCNCRATEMCENSKGKPPF